MSKPRAFVASGVLLATAAATPALAQSMPPARDLMFNPHSVQPQRIAPAQPAAKTQPSTQTPAAKRNERTTVSRPAAAPKRDTARTTVAAPTAKTPPEPAAAPQFGRVPLDTGSIGLTTDTQLRSTHFSDGRTTPGFENVQRKDSSYLGLSLSVPTDKQTILPLPFLSRPD